MSLKLRDGVYHWRKMIDGHTFSQSTKTADLKVASALATMWEASALKEVMVKGTKPVNLHAVIAAFLAARDGKPSRVSAEQHLRHFLKLPNSRMSDLTEAQVQGIVNKRKVEDGISHNTLVVMVSYWNALIAFADKRKWTTGPKLERMSIERTRIRYLTLAEEERLLAAVHPDQKYRGKCAATDAAKRDNWDLLVCLSALGARYSEVGQMTWDAVDLEKRRVLVHRRKGGTAATLVMSDRLYEVLSRRKATSTGDLIFPSKSKYNANDQWFRKALRRANISEEGGKLSLHTLRHGYANRMLGAGMSLVEVKNLLGHRNISSTMVYAHVETNAAAEKAALILNAL